MNEEIIDPNGLIINVFDYDAKHKEDVAIEIQYGPMTFLYHLPSVVLDEFYIACDKPDITFNISGKTANKLYDLLIEGRSDAN